MDTVMKIVKPLMQSKYPKKWRFDGGWPTSIRKPVTAKEKQQQRAAKRALRQQTRAVLLS